MTQSTGQCIFLTSLKILLKLHTIPYISSELLSSLSLRSAPAQKYPSSELLKITALRSCCLFISFTAKSSFLYKSDLLNPKVPKIEHFSSSDLLTTVELPLTGCLTDETVLYIVRMGLRNGLLCSTFYIIYLCEKKDMTYNIVQIMKK